MAETPKKKPQSKAAAAIVRYKNKLAASLEKNETLQAASAKMKKTFNTDNRTNLMIAGGAGVAGVVVGYKLQEKIANSNAPAMAKQIAGIPTLTIGAALLAAAAAWKLKGEMAAGAVGLLGGTSGGAAAHKIATTPKKV